MRFVDRRDAGRQLAQVLQRFSTDDCVVLGLPRGGVPVAFEVAAALGAPLDVIVVRKLGVPVQPELAMGAVGEDGVRVLDEQIVRRAHVSTAQVEEVERRERAELERRAARFRGDRSRLDLTGRTALLIDDGIATGSTARAACRVARAHGARKVVVAAPVAPPGVSPSLARDADEVIVLDTPERFAGVGQFYADFSQTADEEVVALLASGAGEDVGEEMAGDGQEVPVDPDLDPPAVSTRSRPGRPRRPPGPRPAVVGAIAAGGALGTAARDGVGKLLPAHAGGFPVGTLTINLTGSFLLGFLVVLMIERFPPSRFARPFLAIGLLGAYTTYSTFAVDTALLVRGSHGAVAAVYVAASIIGGLVAAWAGAFSSRLVPLRHHDRS